MKIQTFETLKCTIEETVLHDLLVILKHMFQKILKKYFLVTDGRSVDHGHMIGWNSPSKYDASGGLKLCKPFKHLFKNVYYRWLRHETLENNKLMQANASQSWKMLTI